MEWRGDLRVQADETLYDYLSHQPLKVADPRRAQIGDKRIECFMIKYFFK